MGSYLVSDTEERFIFFGGVSEVERGEESLSEGITMFLFFFVAPLEQLIH